MRSRATIAGLAVLFCCLPLTASANAVIPIMVVAVLGHLIFGNVIVGCLEGSALIALFRVKWWKALLVMLVANYVSSFGGLALLPLLAPGPDLYTLWHCLWVTVPLAYLLTLLLEWPFIAFCLKGKPRWLAKSILACLVLQTLSYTALYCWYAKWSLYSLYTEAEVVPLGEIALPKGLRLYFIAAGDGDVYARDLDGNRDTWVADLDSVSSYDCLVLKAPEKGVRRWELLAWHSLEDADRFGESVIVADVAEDVPRPVEGEDDEATFYNGLVPRLGEAEQSEWKFRSGYEAGNRLEGRREGTQSDSIQLVCDMPLAYWPMSRATHLPGDLVVFQLGDRQICVLDVNRRKVALLAYGRGPVVVVPKTDDQTPPP